MPACSWPRAEATTSEAGTPLEGTEWTLVSGVEAPSDAVPTLTLSDGSASGFGGCNTFSGDYELDGDSITIGPIASTMMACEEAKSAAESAYLPGARGRRLLGGRGR